MILVESIKMLELSPTQFLRVQSSYNALANELQKSNASVIVYPQGSIRLGTTIRPFKENKDAEFDVDLVALYPVAKYSVLPQEIRDYVGDVLKNNGTYSSKLSEKKRCWRIDYSQQDDIGFHADIVPAIPEDYATVYKILPKDGLQEFVDSAIAITEKENSDSRAIWCSSNPKGYADWFDMINRKNYSELLEQKRHNIYKDNVDLFSSVEEVPLPLVKSPMQRIIQLLKRHRDVCFSKSPSEKDKPISIIITTLVAETVDKLALNSLNLVELLIETTNALIEAGSLIDDQNYSSYRVRDLLYRKDGEWIIPNPVNTKENFADKWNSNPAKARAFFNWLKAIENDIILNSNDEDFDRILCEKLAITYPDPLQKKEKIITVNKASSSKPWRNQ